MNLIDDTTYEAAILIYHCDGDTATGDAAAEAAFTYAHAALTQMLLPATDTIDDLQQFTDDLRRLARNPIQYIVNELAAITAFTLSTMQWDRDIPPLPQEIQQLTAAHLLTLDQQPHALRWLAELLWWGSERDRTQPAPMSHEDLIQEAHVALVMSTSVLRGLPRPLDGLTAYLQDIDAL